MSTNTAKLILKRHGLLCFDLRELSSLLADRYHPLPGCVREAIITLRHPQATPFNRPQYATGGF